MTNAPLKTVSSDKCSPAGGHYSPGVVHNGVMYVSGQLPFRPELDRDAKMSPADQARACLQNVIDIAEAAGADRERVIKTTVFISNMDAWGSINEVYQEFFPNHKPARCVVPCGPLHFGFEVEIEAIVAVS